MKAKKPIALISDFDGTISIDDFFWCAIKEYLDDNSLQPWNDYLDKKITHFEALSKIFGQIRAPKEDFDRFIDVFPIEEKFVDTLALCNSKGIEFYIVSAGADYYIKRILDRIVPETLKYNLITNKSIYQKEQGLKLIKHSADYEFYDEKVGVTKPGVVQFLKDKNHFCIFAGDGRPDFPAAKLADVVFARKALLELCTTENLKTEVFDSYQNIYNFVDKLEIE